jgi:arginyl-tRNA synthetase
MDDYRLRAAEALSGTLQMPTAEIADLFQAPPDPSMGDLGLPCFAFAKVLRKNPAQIASELAGGLEVPAGFAKVEAAGPYLNFTIDTGALAVEVLRAARDPQAQFGSGTEGAGRTVVIDFSSPNIAKPLAIHHIRSTILGAALARLYAFRGYTVERLNHLGDWGTNFGQLMVVYKKRGVKEDQALTIQDLLEMYVTFHKMVEEDQALHDEARAWFVKLEQGDEEAVRLWELFCWVTLKDFRKLYERLNVAFDHFIGESFFNDRIPETIERLKKKGLAEMSEGALVVKLEDEGLPPCLLRKRDGSTLYATRDLAAAEYRHERWGFEACLYVVANQQELHFRQVFTVLEKMGYAWAKGCEHVKFGMLSFGEGVFESESGEHLTASTRRGRVIFLEDVLNRAVEKARALVLENARTDEVRDEVETLAEQIGVGAIIFNEMAQRRMKDVVFSWDRALNLHGDSGPYLQYTHARLSSVLERYGKPIPEEIDFSPLGTGIEMDVVKAVGRFPGAVDRAVRENEPSIVADYLLGLAATFNRFFTDKTAHRIIGPDEALTLARLGLVDAVRRTIATGLELLGLEAPERM